MNVHEVRVPKFGMSGLEVEIIEIPVAVGDRIGVGDTVVEAASDKVDFSIDAEAAGTVEAIHCAVGDVKDMGDVLVTLTAD